MKALNKWTGENTYDSRHKSVERKQQYKEKKEQQGRNANNVKRLLKDI
jgi:hypothetical protein